MNRQHTGAENESYDAPERNNTAMRPTGRTTRLPKGRVALLLTAGLAALIGLLGALVRSNLIGGLPAVVMPDDHGVLMVFGFLGSAIGLERAVAYRGGGKRHVRWCFAAPLLGGVGTLVLLVSTTVFSLSGSGEALRYGHVVAAALWTASMAMLFAIYIAIWRRQPSGYILIQLIASMLGVAGILLWAGRIDAAVLAPSWLMFLVLTIVGERAELARSVFSGHNIEIAILMLCLLNVLMLIVQCLNPDIGYPLLGLALAALLVAMISHDIARGTWNHGGLPGFMGTCMMSAYGWGLIAACIWVFAPMSGNGYWTDFALHALAIGFIVTMVIAHVCMIVPSIIHRPLPFHPVLWAAWTVLQLGLALRCMGTVRNMTMLWKIGDAFSVLGMLMMMLSVVLLAVFGKRILARKRDRRAAQAKSGVTNIQSRTQLLQDGQASSRERIQTSEHIPFGAPSGDEAVRTLKPMMISSAVAVVLVMVFVIYALIWPSRLVAPNGIDHIANDGFATTSSTTSSQDLSASISPTGHTTTVNISVDGMSFVPSSIFLPAGDALVVKFSNTGDQRHNLLFANGKESGSVPVGDHATIKVGIIGADTMAWCSLAGHRQMGMELAVHATGGAQSNANTAKEGVAPSTTDDISVPSAAELKAYAKTATPADATLPSEESGTTRDSSDRQYTFQIKERKEKLAQSVTRTVWSYDDQDASRDKGTQPLSPGPVLRGRVGETFHIHMVNMGTMSHSIDFHAGTAVPQEMMRNIEPGASLDYTFTAEHAGIWMYHCSSEPMSNHIANGMFGAVIIEPDDLPQVDAEYVLVGSEIYMGKNGDIADSAKVAAMEPDITAFNGRAFQYDAHPLTVKAGGRIRIWVLDAGPNMQLSFHVVGTQFDTVWSEGRYLIAPAGTQGVSTGVFDAGAQVLPLEPAQGGFVEMNIEKPGKYPFVNHVMSLAEKGQHGFIEVK